MKLILLLLALISMGTTFSFMRNHKRINKLSKLKSHMVKNDFEKESNLLKLLQTKIDVSKNFKAESEAIEKYQKEEYSNCESKEAKSKKCELLLKSNFNCNYLKDYSYSPLKESHEQKVQHLISINFIMKCLKEIIGPIKEETN